MLAWPYGSPDAHSGYVFSDPHAGPPHAGAVNSCDGDGWKCQHAWREIASMVGLRNTAGSAPVAKWWDNGANAIAFSRGGHAFVAINREGSRPTQSYRTGLAAGEYARC